MKDLVLVRHLRVSLHVQVEQLEREVAGLQQALANKQKQEHAMLQVLISLFLYTVLLFCYLFLMGFLSGFFFFYPRANADYYCRS